MPAERARAVSLVTAGARCHAGAWRAAVLGRVVDLPQRFLQAGPAILYHLVRRNCAHLPRLLRGEERAHHHAAGAVHLAD
eukprot:scaffold51578_cov63-Phaeocystis_antarctica.AAC.5